MATKEKQQKKKRGRSVQDLIGVKTFTKYGLATNKGELLFYLVSPTNISVLSHANIEIKIRHLMMVYTQLTMKKTLMNKLNLIPSRAMKKQNLFLQIKKQHL